MKLSFIIVTYQRNELLQQCLASIYVQKNLPQPYEVIVINNGGDLDLVAPEDANVIFMLEHSPDNLGVAGGRNLGMQRASGDYLIFIDDDAVWKTENEVAKFVEIFDQNPKCGAIAVKSYDPHSQQVIEFELPHPNKEYAKNLSRKAEVPYFYGVGHAIRASAIQEIGDYPVRYFYSMEEIDLSLRLIDKGYRLIYDPMIGVYHYQSKLGRSVLGIDYWYRNALNKCRMAFRLLPFRYVFSTLFIWSGYIFLKTRNPLVVLKVWWDLWRERKLLRQERQPIKPRTVQYLRRIGARLWY